MLELEPSVRTELWSELVEAMESAIEPNDGLPVFTEQDADEGGPIG